MDKFWNVSLHFTGLELTGANSWSLSAQERRSVSHQKYWKPIRRNMKPPAGASTVQVRVTYRTPPWGGQVTPWNHIQEGLSRTWRLWRWTVNTNSKIIIPWTVKSEGERDILLLNSILFPPVAKCLIFHGPARLNIRCLQSGLQKLWHHDTTLSPVTPGTWRNEQMSQTFINFTQTDNILSRKGKKGRNKSPFRLLYWYISLLP